MLKVNQLSGFGGAAGGEMLIATGTASNTSSPSFTVNLGPPGIKQVICAFACQDTSGNDPWTWDTGSVGGEAFTYATPAGQEVAGDGVAFPVGFTGGATVRALQTSLGGNQSIAISMSTFSAAMDSTVMLAIVVRGYSATPLAADSGDSEGGSDGDNFTISTVGARLVIGAAVATGAAGSFQGPGSEVTAYSSGNLALGYDLTPAGGGADVYSFTGASKYVIAGASFG